MAHVEGAFDQVNERLGSIERRLDLMDSRFNHVDSRFNHVDSRFDRLTGLVIGAWVTMVATQMTTILTILFHH
jgi:tetrahydromethanopterin S-methyltransferase subunit G